MPNPTQPPDDATTHDRLAGGKVTLRQSKAGYRAGMDAALLAAALDLKPGERALEAGCGPGGAMLQAAVRAPLARFVGIERDEAALDLARRNIVENALEDRVEAKWGDVADPAAVRGAAFDLAYANPPFFDDPASLRGPAPAKTGAWLADDGLQAWTRPLLAAVKDGGRVILIHRADRLGDLLALLGEGGGSFRIRPIQPFADAPAKRVLIQAVKGGRAPLMLLPALVLHARDGGKHTPEADSILRGEAALSWR